MDGRSTKNAGAIFGLSGHLGLWQSNPNQTTAFSGIEGLAFINLW